MRLGFYYAGLEFLGFSSREIHATVCELSRMLLDDWDRLDQPPDGSVEGST